MNMFEFMCSHFSGRIYAHKIWKIWLRLETMVANDRTQSKYTI